MNYKLLFLISCLMSLQTRTAEREKKSSNESLAGQIIEDGYASFPTDYTETAHRSESQSSEPDLPSEGYVKAVRWIIFDEETNKRLCTEFEIGTHTPPTSKIHAKMQELKKKHPETYCIWNKRSIKAEEVEVYQKKQKKNRFSRLIACLGHA